TLQREVLRSHKRDRRRTRVAISRRLGLPRQLDPGGDVIGYRLGQEAEFLVVFRRMSPHIKLPESTQHPLVDGQPIPVVSHRAIVAPRTHTSVRTSWLRVRALGTNCG